MAERRYRSWSCGGAFVFGEQNFEGIVVGWYGVSEGRADAIVCGHFALLWEVGDGLGGGGGSGQLGLVCTLRVPVYNRTIVPLCARIDMTRSLSKAASSMLLRQLDVLRKPKACSFHSVT